LWTNSTDMGNQRIMGYRYFQMWFNVYRLKNEA